MPLLGLLISSAITRALGCVPLSGQPMNMPYRDYSCLRYCREDLGNLCNYSENIWMCTNIGILLFFANVRIFWNMYHCLSDKCKRHHRTLLFLAIVGSISGLESLLGQHINMLL